jgi:hypothetical protein
MQTYKNDYTQKEDYALWELHEIRNKMAKEISEFTKINDRAIQMVDRYGLKKVKLIHTRNVNPKEANRKKMVLK